MSYLVYEDQALKYFGQLTRSIHLARVLLPNFYRISIELSVSSHQKLLELGLPPYLIDQYLGKYRRPFLLLPFFPFFKLRH